MNSKGCFRVFRWLIIPVVVISFIVFVYMRYIKSGVESDPVDAPTGI